MLFDMGSIDRSRRFIINSYVSLRAPVATTLLYKLAANKPKFLVAKKTKALLNSVWFFRHVAFLAPALNSTSCLFRDLNILRKYEWPSIRWSWSVTDGENFHLHSSVVYSSAVLPACNLDDLLVGDSQARQNLLSVSTSSCGSSSGNNNHRWISQGTRIQLVSPDELDIHGGWKWK